MDDGGTKYQKYKFGDSPFKAVEPDVQVGIVDLLVVAGAVAGTHRINHI